MRTREVRRELERRCSVEVVTRPRTAGEHISSRARPIVGRMVRSVLIDRAEPWSRRRFRNWEPDADGALLVGLPLSPLAFASRRLSALDIPYVVDIGDPWVLTAERPEAHALGRSRSRRAETEMWSGAAGGIVTTSAQRDALLARFPDLPFLVRPNGFEAGNLARPASPPTARTTDTATLRLVHFGATRRARIDVRPFLQGLARKGSWHRVEFTQFGTDWSSTLDGLGPEIDVQIRDPLPWPEVLRRATAFDAALVIANADLTTLPSKVVSYLSLPIPRVALTPDPEHDSIGTYLRDKDGWLVLRPDAPDAPALIRAHVDRDWTPGELAPPASESWEAVARQIADFVLDVVQRVDAPGSATRAS